VFCRTDDLKVGNLMGVDKFGNKYFENNAYFVGEL
jgi:NADH dehydrogenase (ubiquinone) 1 alpha subcomplex subunit 12